ncbi:hypothetical protein [Streptomyces sp. NPDC001070]
MKRINALSGAPIDALTGAGARRCNEKSKVVDAHKSALSDLADVGAYQN